MKARIGHLSFILYGCMAMSLLFACKAQAQQLQQLHDHVRSVVSNGQAKLVGPLPSTQQLHLSIALPLRNQTELNSLLDQLYDPSSAQYRQFLSVEQFTEQFGPTVADYQAVVDFAKANGFTITDTPKNRLIVPILGTAAQIEKAFNVRMNLYQHPTENRTFFSPDREPSLNLSVPVTHVVGMNNYSIPQPLYQQSASGSGSQSNPTGSGPYGSFLGSDRRAAYYGGTSLTGSGQSVGLMEFDGYALTDVQAYFKNVGQALNVPINNVLLGGLTYGGSDGNDTEQAIDIIDAVSMAPGLSQVLVYIAPLYNPTYGNPVYGGDGDLLIFNRMATDNIAKQLSVSWYWYPDDPSVDDTVFKEFQTQGQTLLVASGDYGYWSGTRGAYPAEDNYVTGVGGTLLTTCPPSGVDPNGNPCTPGTWESEVAWGGSNSTCLSGGGSGGGIAQNDGNFPIPSYQQIVGVINSSNQGSTTLRNGPDVAAEANCDNYACANGACSPNSQCLPGDTHAQCELGGTSLAAPTWAGFMALVNQQAAAAGQNTVGFLNRVIYPIGVDSNYDSNFHDIMNGDNGYFSAVPGYDLVTGWGSPNGQGLINSLSGVNLSGVNPGFAVSATQLFPIWPSILPANTVSMGHALAYTVNVTSINGFTGTVNLAASGLPAGISASFSSTSVAVPSPPLSGSATMLITAGYGAGASPPPPFTLTITATASSGSLSNSTGFTLTPRAMQYAGDCGCGISGGYWNDQSVYAAYGWSNYPNMPTP